MSKRNRKKQRKKKKLLLLFGSKSFSVGNCFERFFYIVSGRMADNLTGHGIVCLLLTQIYFHQSQKFFFNLLINRRKKRVSG